MKKTVVRCLIAAMLVLVMALAIMRPSQHFYPVLEFTMPDNSAASMSAEVQTSKPGLIISFLFEPKQKLSDCEALTGNIVRVILTHCVECRVQTLRCDTSLSEAGGVLLSESPISSPAGRMNNGVVVFKSTNSALALGACQATQTQSANSNSPVLCADAMTPRPKPAPPSLLSAWTAALLLAAASASWLVGWLIIRYEYLHAHLSHDLVGSGPQKYHNHPTPRIGGLTVMMGLLAGGAVMIATDSITGAHEFGLLLLAAVPAFIGGLVEDITKKVGVLERLLLTMLASAMAAWLLTAQLNRLDVPGLDELIRWSPLSIAFTVFAVAGIANAINILDGYNGLVGGYSIIVLAALAWVADRVGDGVVFTTAVVLAGALVGFLRWNWPSGKIFLGDGGAYLLGFLLGDLAVLLVVRNPGVSPWFPVLLMIHPVFETVYSVYRRKLKQGLSPGQPDNKHLHQLIFSRITVVGQSRLTHNSRVAKFIWLPAAIFAFAACVNWRSTGVLMGLTVLYCAFYVGSYSLLSKRRGLATQH